jgi:hypothetical protein
MSLTVGFSTRVRNPEFIEYLKKSSGFKSIEVIEKVNNGEKSLSQVYNEIIKESSNNIVVLCHDDIYFETTSWYHKLIKHFEKSDYGILGMAGTTYMPKSGRWWEDRKKMFGIVNHEHEGKKWESKYSSGFGNNIKECVVVDGLFIAIDKRKIKKEFDETVTGFHFYDIEFCFQNFLEGVKIGVITNVRITHKSIGATNQQWEDNRKIFAKKFQSDLPKYLLRDKDERLKILISASQQSINPTELKLLVQKCFEYNWEVSIITDNEKIVRGYLSKFNINYYSPNNPPGYKVGDGRWYFNALDGVKVSQPGMLYKVSELNQDLMFVIENTDTVQLCKLYPSIPKIIVSENKATMSHNSLKSSLPVNDFSKDIIFDYLDNEYQKLHKQKVKIVSGYSEKGGSTVAQINLTNFLNDNGYDCTFYGPSDYHIDKCKSAFTSELKFDSDDILLCHVMDFKERPPVKKVIYCSHEKWWYDFSKVFWYWDEAVFLHQQHKDFHQNYTGNYSIIPNIKENLTSKSKPDLDLVAGIIGTIEDRKQTHISIDRALSDECEKILLYGQIGDKQYFEKYVEPKIDNDKIVLVGHSSDKQSMYDSVGRVYHSSKGEVACLVKDECYLTGTKFFGNEETENEVSTLSNEETLKLWEKIFKK